MRRRKTTWVDVRALAVSGPTLYPAAPRRQRLQLQRAIGGQHPRRRVSGHHRRIRLIRENPVFTGLSTRVSDGTRTHDRLDHNGDCRRGGSLRLATVHGPCLSKRAGPGERRGADAARLTRRLRGRRAQGTPLRSTKTVIVPTTTTAPTASTASPTVAQFSAQFAPLYAHLYAVALRYGAGTRSGNDNTAASATQDLSRAEVAYLQATGGAHTAAGCGDAAAGQHFGYSGLRSRPREICRSLVDTQPRGHQRSNIGRDFLSSQHDPARRKGAGSGARP